MVSVTSVDVIMESVTSVDVIASDAKIGGKELRNFGMEIKWCEKMISEMSILLTQFRPEKKPIQELQIIGFFFTQPIHIHAYRPYL